MPRLARLALAPLLLLAAGCAAAPPRHAAVHDGGVVRAEDPEAAAEYAALVAELRPRIAALVPDTTDRDTEVWVQRRLRHRRGAAAPDNVKGFTLIGPDSTRGRIHVREGTDHPEWFLAHELVHAQLGPSWSTLPGVLEEGLCDVVAAKLDPEAAPRIRALRAIEASIFFGRMRLALIHAQPETHRDDRELEIWFHYEGGASSVDMEAALESGTLELKRRWTQMPDSLYGLGFLIASRAEERIGLGGLHGLCVRAAEQGHETVPLAWLLHAADLDDPVELARAPTELLGQSEFDEWRELLPAFHADLLAQLFAGYHRRYGAEEFLAAVNPRLRLGDGTVLALAGVEGLAEELERRWREDAYRGR